MKLAEALSILRSVKRRDGELFACFLATGMNPLHLNTFLAAELGLLFPHHRIEVQQCSTGRLSEILGEAPGVGCTMSRRLETCESVLQETQEMANG